MGRRKIEIRAIKDDRNRSVTFLKRKGGLFKKAHELSVLCSVDVAVIIFGHNKKLYEFSSGDIQETLQRYQYYGQPHEHKGPQDFKGRGGGDDDDEDDEIEDISTVREDSVPAQMVPAHLQHHNSFTHLRQPAPSASPPMPNGLFPRQPALQPGQPPMISRPSSQNTIRRSSSHLVPLQHAHSTPPPPQNGFAYMPNPPIYNSNAPPPPQPSPRPQFQQFQPQASSSAPSHQQIQQSHQAYIQEQRRPSQPQATLHAPPQPLRRASPQPEQQQQQQQQQQQSLRPPEYSPPQLRQNSKSHSIFTPIDEGGSVLATFFGSGEASRLPVKREHSPESRIIKPPPRAATGSESESQAPQSQTEFAPPSRSNTTGSKSGPRPKLNLQIPLEASDGEDDSPRRSGDAISATPAKTSTETHHSGIHLPPPSPSASAVLSAGASGPPNPFARPMPPNSSVAQVPNAYADNRNNAETPMSALPSRFIADNLLPSPGGFYDWDSFGKNGLNSAVLPSPLTFGTPLNTTSPNIERTAGENTGDKRKVSEERVAEAKKIKT